MWELHDGKSRLNAGWWNTSHCTAFSWFQTFQLQSLKASCCVPVSVPIWPTTAAPNECHVVGYAETPRMRPRLMSCTVNIIGPLKRALKLMPSDHSQGAVVPWNSCVNACDNFLWLLSTITCELLWMCFSNTCLVIFLGYLWIPQSWQLCV